MLLFIIIIVVVVVNSQLVKVSFTVYVIQHFKCIEFQREKMKLNDLGKQN